MFLSSDGEAIILQEAFSEELIGEYNSLGIDQVKHGPTMTADHQSSDVADTFRDVKMGNKMASKKRKDSSNPTLNKNLLKYFAEFKISFPSSEPSAYLKAKIIQAISQLVFVFKDKYFTADKIREGFVRCGQHIKAADPEKGESTVDYDKIMSRTRAVCSDAEMATMKDNLPAVVAEMRRAGRVTNDFLDGLGIPIDHTASSRDELVLCRQDAQLITHTETIQRYQDYQAEKLHRSNPANIALKKQLADAKRLVSRKLKETSALQTKEVKKAAQAQAAAVEKARKSLLSPKQRRDEMAAQRSAKLRAKEATAEAQQAAYDRAIDLLGEDLVAELHTQVAGGAQHPVADLTQGAASTGAPAAAVPNEIEQEPEEDDEAEEHEEDEAEEQEAED